MAEAFTYKGNSRTGKITKTSGVKIKGFTQAGRRMAAESLDRTRNYTKNQLKALRIKEKADVERTKIQGRQANVANVTTQLGLAAQRMIGARNNSSNSTAINQVTSPNSSVQQLVDGGISSGATNTRDDDDSDWAA